MPEHQDVSASYFNEYRLIYLGRVARSIAALTAS